MCARDNNSYIIYIYNNNIIKIIYYCAYGRHGQGKVEHVFPLMIYKI